MGACLTWAPGVEEQDELPELVGRDRTLVGVNANFQEVSTHGCHGRSAQAYVQGGGSIGLQGNNPGAWATTACEAKHCPCPFGQVWQGS